MGNITQRYDSTDAKAYVCFERTAVPEFQGLVHGALATSDHLETTATDKGILVREASDSQEGPR